MRISFPKTAVSAGNRWFKMIFNIYKYMRFFRAAGLAAVLACSLSGCGNPGKKSNEQGLAAYENREWEQAASLFRQAATQDGSVAAYRVNLGMVLYEQGRCDEALAQFDNALELDPENILAIRGRGLVLLFQKQYDEAAACFTEAMELAGGDGELRADLRAYRARARELGGHYTEAAEDCEQLIQDGYETDAMHLALANLLLKTDPDEPSKAMRHYQEAIRNEFRDYSVWLNILENLKAADCTEEYNLVLSRALAMEAESEADILGKGLLYLYDGQVKQAFSAFEMAYNRGYEPAGYWLGCCYEQNGEFEEAALVYQKLLLSDPESGRLYNQLAACKIRSGRMGEALLLIDQGLEYAEDGTRADLMWNRAVCYERIRDYAKAEKAFREYLKFRPGDQDALTELSYLSSR